jgi:hypothetical protein
LSYQGVIAKQYYKIKEEKTREKEREQNDSYTGSPDKQTI